MALTGYAKVKAWRKNTKQKMFEAFGGKCGYCGLVDDPIIYDYHHLDPSKKEFSPTSSSIAWEKLVEEAKKCAMLCSHCHRKLHSNMIELTDVIYFNEELITSDKNNRWGFKD